MNKKSFNKLLEIMIIRTIHFSILFILFFIPACIEENTEVINKYDWLLGTWKNTTKQHAIFESWSKKSNTEFRGISYLLDDQDTVVLEYIRLVQEDNELFYIPTVKDQNDSLPIRFSINFASKTELVFQNQQHDFPQTIKYQRVAKDSLVAEISGINNGEFSKRTFPMKRVK
jgi:hypothetical protein